MLALNIITNKIIYRHVEIVILDARDTELMILSYL